ALTACGRNATPELIRALTSLDVDVRKQVVDVLGAIGDARAEAGLCRALEDVDPNVRAAAADALASLERCGATEPLARLAAEDPELLVRLAALRALVRLEAPIPLATIEAAIADPLLAVAGYAALGQSGAAEAPDTILKGVLSRRASVRDAAARAITALAGRAAPGDAAQIEARVRAFAAAHPEVAQHAGERLEASEPLARLAAVQFAAMLRSPATARVLAQCGLDEVTAGAACAALGALGGDLPQALAQAWPQLSAAERAFACTALAAGGGAGAERMLRTILLDSSSEVRAAAARALASCATAVSFGELIGTLAKEDARAPRDAAEDETDALIEAILQLGEREGGEAIDAAIALVDTRLLRGSERARIAGARLLARLARPADAARVRGLLADPSERVRRSAVEAIARIGPAGDDLLRVALADEAPSVRCAAARAAAEIGSPSADSDLAALADDRDARVRAAVMSALALRAALPASREAALALLANGLRGDDVVALAALSSLQRFGGADAAAIAAFALRSSEPEIVERAVACVGAHGGHALHLELVALLAHSAWPVRARAASELAAQRALAALPHLHARLAVERDEFVCEALLSALTSLES
ncbi:MAG: HEAT repeat domain-containing protein, partial [Myxococcota bacterium]